MNEMIDSVLRTMIGFKMTSVDRKRRGGNFLNIFVFRFADKVCNPMSQTHVQFIKLKSKNIQGQILSMCTFHQKNGWRR